MTERAGVTFIIMRPRGEMLMQLRDDGNGKPIRYPNAWSFPGGAQEDGEAFLHTAIREIKEEYGLKVNEGQCEPLTVYAHDDILGDHVFVCRVNAQARPALYEGAAMQWMTLKEINGIDLAFEQKQLLPLIEAYLRHG
ncbi:MAG: NUDIX domain-containing protein [bacterium]|nr:NUDIX domain-containing protein [bacterium]MDZ4296694.1 NUDIX domain-containing protein [Patescibacteria group bacterium]